MSGLRSLLPPGLRAGRRIGDRPQVLHFRAGPPGSPFPNNIGVRTVAGAAPLRWSPPFAFKAAADRRGSSEEAMRNEYSYPEPDGVENRVAEEAAAYESEGLPNRLLNAREVAKVRRLPRRDGSSGILARTAPSATLRRPRKEV